MRVVPDTSFTLPWRVALYDLDLRDEVSCSTLFRYFEEAAIRGSAHFGFDLDWYRQHKHFWVIRTLQLERVCAPTYQTDLEIRTWVSSMDRVRSDRNYVIRRAVDGRLLARGIANWVYVDAEKMMPARVHPEISALFEPIEPPALPPVGKVTFSSASPLAAHTLRLHPRYYETDSAQHVNNAVYVDWMEEAIRETLTSMGYHLALDRSTPYPWFYRHELEYLRSAMPSDEIELRVRLVRRGSTFGSWQVELVRQPNDEPMVRARATTVWVDAHNRPVPWHAAVRS